MAAAGGGAVFISERLDRAAAGDDWAIDRDMGLVTHQRITPLSTVAAVLSSTRPMVAALRAFFTSTGTSPPLLSKEHSSSLIGTYGRKQSAERLARLVLSSVAFIRLYLRFLRPIFRPKAAMELGFIHIVVAADADYRWPRGGCTTRLEASVGVLRPRPPTGLTGSSGKVKTGRIAGAIRRLHGFAQREKAIHRENLP